MFTGGEADIRSVAAHNVHENVGEFQEGGTALLAYGPIIEHHDLKGSCKDETGLGRWVVMTLVGEEGRKTKLVCGYNPCYNRKLVSNTSYQQHRHYFIHHGQDVCPRAKFREDLRAQLSQWRREGFELIVCLDANEHIYKGSLGRMLTDREGLSMIETVSESTGRPLGATFFRGKRPIDGV